MAGAALALAVARVAFGVLGVPFALGVNTAAGVWPAGDGGQGARGRGGTGVGAPGPAAIPHPPRNPRSRDLRFDYFQIRSCVKFDLRKHFFFLPHAVGLRACNPS